MNQKQDGLLQFEEDDVVEISKSIIFDGMVIPVAVYLSVSASSFVRIGNPGEKVQFSKMKGFNRPDTRIAVLKKDYPTFQTYLTSLTAQIMSHKNVPAEIKVQFLDTITNDVFASLEVTQIVDFQQFTRVSKVIQGFSEAQPGFDAVVKILAGLPNEDARHSVAVSMIALLICEEMNIKQKSVLDKVAFAGLVHDIGLKSVPKSILKKPKYERTPEETKIYESHPFLGTEMIRDIKEVSHDVLLMVMEHHENALGTGFPKKIRDVKISPLGRILIVAEFVTEFLYGQMDQGKNPTVDDAVKYIEDILGQPFNKAVFLALKNLANKSYLKRKAGLTG